MKDKMTGGIRLAAAAGALVLAGLGLGGPGLAHPHDEADEKGKRVEKIIVMSTRHDGAEGKGKHGARRVRAIRLDGGAHVVDCGDERIAVSEVTGDEREKTKVVICGNTELSAAQRIEKLERALERIRANDGLSAEHKDKVTAALRQAIERLRTTP